MTLSKDGKSYSYLTSSTPTGIRNVIVGSFKNKKPRFPIKLPKKDWLHGPLFGYKGNYLYCHGSYKGEMYSVFKINLMNDTIEKINIPGINIASHFTITKNENLAAFDATQILK